MNYVEKNEEILKDWFQQYQELGFTGDDFAEDGIMFRGAFKWRENANHWYREASGFENILWANVPLRVLYLTKDQPSEDCGAWDLREECYHDPNSNIHEYKLRREFTFHRILVYSLYGYYASTKGKRPSFEEVSSKKLEEEVVIVSDEFPFARINCKKLVGTRSCPQDKLVEAISKDRDYLREQILSLDADLIICCGNQHEDNAILNMLNEIGYHFEWTDKDSYDVYFDKNKQVAAIDSYHLSYPYGDEKHYKDLVTTWQAFLDKHPDFLSKR